LEKTNTGQLFVNKWFYQLSSSKPSAMVVSNCK